MKRRHLLAAALLLSGGLAMAGDHGHGKAHWGYEGAVGPAHWGDLSPEFATCKTGRNQSPVDVDLHRSIGTTNLPGVKIAYAEGAASIINNGHTIQVNMPAGNAITVAGHRYDLLQFHFHTPSEHQLNGQNLPMEMHLVHKDAHGNLAVIGILYKEGAHNPALQAVIDHLPHDVGQAHSLKGAAIDLKAFFPKNTRFVQYSGSLTTPPCSEGVYWMEFVTPIEASPEQIAAMQKLMGHNNRPVQPHNARYLLQSWSSH